jgi:Response regulator containing a CheY-like receiver domain and an HTH DNA-binding domain
MNLSYLSKEQSNNYKGQMNLTEDEEQIFDMLLKNYTVVKIASVMKMSTRTVDRRIKNIKTKMSVVYKS